MGHIKAARCGVSQPVLSMLTTSSAPGFRENRGYSRSELPRIVATYIPSITTSVAVSLSGDFSGFINPKRDLTATSDIFFRPRSE